MFIKQVLIQIEEDKVIQNQTSKIINQIQVLKLLKETNRIFKMEKLLRSQEEKIQFNLMVVIMIQNKEGCYKLKRLKK